MAKKDENNAPRDDASAQNQNNSQQTNGGSHSDGEKLKILRRRRLAACLLYLGCTVLAVVYLLFWPPFTSSTQVQTADKAHTNVATSAALAAAQSSKAASPDQPAKLPPTARTPRGNSAGDETALMTGEQQDVSLQGIFVLLLTFLAFLMHLLATADVDGERAPREARWVFSLRRVITSRHFLFSIPTLIFFAAMIRRGHQDAAVFLMAVLAIYVAAEHFIALQKQHATARSILAEMSEQAAEIKKHTEGLGTLQTELNKSATEVGNVIAKLNQQVESIRNSLGTPYSQSELYEAYRKPEDRHHESGAKSPNRGIYAVYRLLDIDKEWHDAPLKKKWDVYFDDATSKEALYAALLKGRRDRVLILTDMPLQLVKLWVEGSEPDASRATAFLRFIGLVWHTVVLHEAAKKLENKGVRANYEVRVGDSSNWMHVVDGKVYQLFGQPPNNVYLRNLTLDLARDGGRTGNLVNWAVEDIKRCASRAAGARDYICTVISHALMVEGLHQSNVPLSATILDQVLLDIGFGDWLAQQEGFAVKLSEKDAKALFRELILRFLGSLEGKQTDMTASLIYRELQ